jgi:hypothetical protein
MLDIADVAGIKFYVAHCCLCSWPGRRVVDSRHAPLDSLHQDLRQTSTREVIPLQTLPCATDVVGFKADVCGVCMPLLLDDEYNQHPPHESATITITHAPTRHPLAHHHVRAVSESPHRTCRIEHVHRCRPHRLTSKRTPTRRTHASRTRTPAASDANDSNTAQPRAQYKLNRPDPRSPADA